MDSLSGEHEHLRATADALERELDLLRRRRLDAVADNARLAEKVATLRARAARGPARPVHARLGIAGAILAMLVVGTFTRPAPEPVEHESPRPSSSRRAPTSCVSDAGCAPFEQCVGAGTALGVCAMKDPMRPILPRKRVSE